MKKEEMKNLQPGDLVRHILHTKAAVVTGNYGEHITAVQTFDVSNPSEWIVVQKAIQKKDDKIS